MSFLSNSSKNGSPGMPLNAAGHPAVGQLSPFPFRVMRRVMECLGNPQDLLALSQTCWCLFVLVNEEPFWKAVCLQSPFIDPEMKRGHWSFKGSWKQTVLHPQRGACVVRSSQRNTEEEEKEKTSTPHRDLSWQNENEVGRRLASLLKTAPPSTSSPSTTRSHVRSAADWNAAVAGKPYCAGFSAQYLSVSQGAINYITRAGDVCCPPQYALSYGVLKMGLSSYHLHNLLGENVLDAVPLLPPYTTEAFYATWNHKIAYVEQQEGTSEPYVPLLPAVASSSTPPSPSPFVYDEQVGVAGVVDRRYRLSTEQFQREYESTNTPVVLTGCIDHWPARQRWLAANFCTHYGETWLKPNGRSADGRRFRLQARDFFAYAQSTNGEKPMYVFDKKILVAEPRLRADYDIPPYFDEDFFSAMDEDERPDYRWILIGPDGSGTPYHTDPHASSAWNAVLDGVKRFSFYKPDVIPPGVKEELIHTDYYASQPYMESYRHTFPRLQQQQQQQQPEERQSSQAQAGCSTTSLPLEALVFPGDLIFVPSGWWHQVINYGLTIAVTQNVCSWLTFPRVVQDMNAHAGRGIRRDFSTALARAGRADLASAIVQLPPPVKTKRRRSHGTDNEEESETSSEETESESESATESSEDDDDSSGSI